MVLKNKIIYYFNSLKGKPKNKDIKKLISKLKVKLPKNRKTIQQKYNFIKNKYKIKKIELLHENTVRDLKNYLKKNNVNNIGRLSKKKMFQLLHTIRNQKNRIITGYFSNIGKRDYQEDRLSVYNTIYHYVSAVYDGHAGNKCSTFLKANFYRYFLKNLQNKRVANTVLVDTFKELDNVFLHQINGNDGSTANVLFCNKKTNTCYIANTGDSRAILCYNNNRVLQISEDHKPNNPIEKKRIEQRGGFVKYNRTNGNLAMSRAFGDKNLKQVLIVDPDVYKFSMHNIRYVLQASDGLFDVMSNSEVCGFVNSRLNKKMNPQDIAKELVYYAIKIKKTLDNTSVIISLF